MSKKHIKGLGIKLSVVSLIMGLTAGISVLLVAPQPVSAAVTSSVSGGTLTVNGDAASDTITIKCEFRFGIYVLINGAYPDTGPEYCSAISAITVNGGGGNDTIDLSDVTTGPFTSLNSVNLNGGDGDDTIIGSEFNDIIQGGNDDDTLLHGGPGHDTLIGGNGSDTLAGGPGNDWYTFLEAPAAETDTITEKAGEGTDDTLNFFLLPAGSSLTVTMHDGTNPIASHLNRTINMSVAADDAHIEHVRGSPGDDTITGNAADNLIVGGDGNDTIDGRGGHDTLEGEAGSDTLTGGEGVDTIDGGPGHDTLIGGNGSDTLAGGPGNDWYTFLETSATETDTITEKAGEGTDDTLNFFLLPAGSSLIVTMHDGTNPIASHLNRTINMSAAADDAHIEHVRGSQGDDIITGNAADNLIVGGDGHDVIDGRGSNDTLEGEAGSDTLTGGEGDDALVGGPGPDTYVFGPAAAAETDTVTELSDPGFPDTLDFRALSADDPVTCNLTQDAPVCTHTNRTVNADTAAHLENVAGGAGDDHITGNAADNDLLGNAGHDTLDGLGGSDHITGGNDDDTLTGGPGNDTLIGGNDDDTLTGGADDDTYLFWPAAAETDTVTELAGEGLDTLDFQTLSAADPVTCNLTQDAPVCTHTNRTVNADTAAHLENVNGGAGDDNLTGNAADNGLFGNAGHDTLDGGAGQDTLDGGAGNDTLTGGADDDTLIGGNDDDTYVFASAAVAETDTIEEGAGGGTDTLDFSALPAPANPVTVNMDGNNPIAVHPNRTVDMSAAADDVHIEKVIGGDSDDTMTGGTSNVTFIGGPGADNLFGGDGDDHLFGGPGIIDHLFGGPGKDTIDGGPGNDVLSGDSDEDILTGGDGDDYLFGGDGDDTLEGGPGNDFYVFKPAAAAETDTISESGGAGIDALDFSALAANDPVTVTMGDGNNPIAQHTNRTVNTSAATDDAHFEWVFGGAGDDAITGNAADNRIAGGAGDDFLDGGAGNDYLDGGADNDTIIGGADNDTIDGGAGNDVLSGDSGDDTIFGGMGDDFLDGGAGNDYLDGGGDTDECKNGETVFNCELNTAQVDPAQGGQLTSPDGQTQVDFPPGAVSASTTVTYTQQTAPIQDVGSFQFACTSFTVEATDANGDPVTTFNQPFTMTIHYTDACWQQAGIFSEAGLNLFYWDTNLSDWVGVLPCNGCSLDTVNNVLVAVLDHLTEFATLGSALAGDMDGNCIVDGVDLQMGANNWRQAGVPPDFDGDGIVTVKDLMQLVTYLGATCGDS